MTRVRKAVIPAAGLGTRFLPASKAVPKEMLPIVDKPVIQYIVECAVASGIEEIVLITATAKRAIEDHFDRFFERYGAKTVFVARFVTGLRVVGAVLAGASGLRWPTFLFYNATGAVVWCSAVATAGYALANSWDTLERWIGRAGVAGLALVIVLFLVARARARAKT